MKTADFAERKEEAIKRMHMIGFNPLLIDKIKDNDEYMLSMNDQSHYVPKAIQEQVKDICDKYDLYPFHLIHNNTTFGELITVLFVSKEKEEWYMDYQMIEQNRYHSYVINLDNEHFSKFGSIQYVKHRSALRRIV